MESYSTFINKSPRTCYTMSITENSDDIESLIRLLKENEKKVDAIAKKMDIIERIITRNPRLSEILNEESSLAAKEPSSRNILVVDDDTKLASSFKLILESEGYNVDTANTGSSALFKMSKKTYDLVILDWNLPDITGDKVAEKIKKEHSDTAIIFITGYSDRLSDVGTENEMLMKPIDPESLLRTALNNIA